MATYFIIVFRCKKPFHINSLIIRFLNLNYLYNKGMKEERKRVCQNAN
ncbi:hypothetical protein HMPREF9148_01624 [Prevotella sp. F0091]|nr:hypothetical protein HMPREF9148_01624 [Prevotella sp. F0091]